MNFNRSNVNMCLDIVSEQPRDSEVLADLKLKKIMQDLLVNGSAHPDTPYRIKNYGIKAS